MYYTLTGEREKKHGEHQCVIQVDMTYCVNARTVFRYSNKRSDKLSLSLALCTCLQCLYGVMLYYGRVLDFQMSNNIYIQSKWMNAPQSITVDLWIGHMLHCALRKRKPSVLFTSSYESCGIGSVCRKLHFFVIETDNQLMFVYKFCVCVYCLRKMRSWSRVDAIERECFYCLVFMHKYNIV